MPSVLFVVAHPDDLAYGMGGMASLLREEVDLHLVCATKGERGCPGHDLNEIGTIREQEQKAACERLGASLDFLGRIDRELYADMETCRLVADAIQTTAPVALFTIWPIDHHPDHSAISEITRKAVFMTQSPIEVVYAEEGENQTAHFTPEIYVDISGVMEEKLALVRCHACQNRDDVMAKECLGKAARRGKEAGCDYAEGYRSLACNGFDGPSIFSSLDQARTIAQRHSS